MNTQIAEEALDTIKIWPPSKGQVLAAIQAAIEKAQKENFKIIATLKDELSSRAAQASEQVEHYSFIQALPKSDDTKI